MTRASVYSGSHCLPVSSVRQPSDTLVAIYLCIGPPTDDGFFYEMGMGVTDRNILESDLTSSASFLGDQNNDSLQRVYGISFSDGKQRTENKAFLAEAAKRDLRKIGKDQELFFFHELSPGSGFFLLHGTRIYNALMELMRSKYRAQAELPRRYGHVMCFRYGDSKDR
ncbi:hypothetical protein JB92DRAFT_1799167 [Gautieria morchelliformis]|nr:hypothetical protein JB92DRAFT_1799167 [Gautieria morchelliformis]